MTRTPRVILIGGAPGAGESSLGLALATHLGWTSLSVDDPLIAAQAVTNPTTHPGLHVMRRMPSLEYAEAARLGANVLRQDSTVSVASHTRQALAWWGSRADTR